MGNRSNNELDVLKATAKRLVVFERLTLKEAAKKAGVTEKTIGKWAKANGWKAAMGHSVVLSGEANSLLWFMIFCKANYIEQFPQIETIYNAYAAKF
jgi:hypothetical protein